MSETVKFDEEFRRIIISGEITEETSAEILLYFLELEKQNLEIDLIFCASPGGCWEHGLGLVELISNSKCYINGYSIGTVSSTSAMMFLACDYRCMSPRASLMFHNGSLSLSDTYKEVINYVELAKNELKKDYKYLSDRSNRPPKFWAETLDKGDFYVDSAKALELKLIEAVKLPSEGE